LAEAAEAAAKTEEADYTPTANEQKRQMDVHERLLAINAEVRPGMCCLPHHLHACKPSFLDSNSIDAEVEPGRHCSPRHPKHVENSFIE
jgi:hypothetical protein